MTPDDKDKKDPPKDPPKPSLDPNDDGWDATIPEPDYAAEAAKWREELHAAVSKADKAEAAESKQPEPKKPEPAPAVAERASARLDAKLDKEKAASLTAAVFDDPAPPKPTATATVTTPKSGSPAPAPAPAPAPRRPKIDEDLGDGDGGGGGRWTKVLIAAAVLLVVIVTLVGLGKWNARDYYLVCGADHITAERGRSFPPWGSRELGGPQWEAIKIPANAECIEMETTDVSELEESFLLALEDQANIMLTSRNPSDIELAEQQLQQALLLTRTTERRDKRKNIERLLGDVEYWRGAAQIQQVIDQLKGAAGRFDGAAVKRPKHTSDSSSWAGFARATAEELRLGPPELRPARPVDPNAPPPFTGTGPDSPIQPQDAGVPPTDAAPGTLLNPPADATPSPPDAGLPRGGVLL